MSGVARRPVKGPVAPNSPATPVAYAESSDSGDHSDPEGRDIESDEYGSAEHSGSEISDRDSADAQEDALKDDSNNLGKPVDHDEDRRNPQYIPKKGTFYEHDDRTAAGGENENVEEISDGISSIELNRIDRNNVSECSDKTPTPSLINERRKTPKSNADRWLHDKYNENDQAPKSSEELMTVYGYDIRGEEGPPKALRRHRYNRGPNKYTRNWEDENAYGKISPVVRAKQPPSVTNGKEFPSLQDRNDKNRPIDKRKRNEKRIVRTVESKVSPDKNANDKIIHDNKVFTNKIIKAEKESIDLNKRQISDDLPRWKNRPLPKTDLRKPAFVMKNQDNQQQERQIKWPELQRVGSPPKSLPVAPSQQVNSSPVSVPLQENKLPPARKINPAQVPPRMQSSTAAVPLPPRMQPSTAAAPVLPSSVVTATSATAPSADSNTRGKRYSSLRQRPMPDTYQPHQQQYISEYQQIPTKQPANQQSISNIAPISHQQTPPPLLQSSTQHHQPIQQLHQQTPPPALPQLHQQTPQIHQQSPQIHQQTAQLHQQQTTQIIQQTPQIHQQTQQIHQPSAQQIHQPSAQQIHQPTAQIHQQSAQMHQQTAQIHQQSAQLIQQNTQMHQPSTQQLHQQAPPIHQQTPPIHQQTPPIHQQTPPPAMQQPQTHHQTPPPAHQSLPRQQPNMPMRQVPRSHQQQMTMHSQQISMSMPQGGLVSSQTYPTPQLMAQNQYIQSANGAVYGHVVPQVYPPPQAYATPQHQPIAPQGIPPQALPPQALAPQAMPPQAMPPQAIPQQAMPPPPPHTYHHQTPPPPPPHQYPAHTGRPVFREPSGITYYSPQEQKGTAPPTRRPTNAIPIVPPPPRERGKHSDSVPPPASNIDHIIDNMFVPRQGRTVARSSETPPRSVDSMRSLEEFGRHSEEKFVEERIYKEHTPEISTTRIEPLPMAVESYSIVSSAVEPDVKTPPEIVSEDVYKTVEDFQQTLEKQSIEDVPHPVKEDIPEEVVCSEPPQTIPMQEEAIEQKCEAVLETTVEHQEVEVIQDKVNEVIVEETPAEAPIEEKLEPVPLAVQSPDEETTVVETVVEKESDHQSTKEISDDKVDDSDPKVEAAASV